MKSKTHSTTIAMSISVVAMLFVIGGAFAGGLLLAPSVNSEAKAAEMAPAQPVEAAQPALQTSSSTDVLAAFEDAFTDLYQDTVPSVVNIRVTKEFDTTDLQRFGFSDDLYRRIIGIQIAHQPVGEGDQPSNPVGKQCKSQLKPYVQPDPVELRSAGLSLVDDLVDQ